MTTISIPLKRNVARRLQAQGAEVGKTTEKYAQDILIRVTTLPLLRGLTEKNAADLRAVGYEQEEDVTAAI